MNEIYNVLIAVLLVASVCALVVIFRVGSKRKVAAQHLPELNEIWTIDDAPIVIRKVTPSEVQWSYVEGGNKLLTNTDTTAQWQERIRERYVRFTGRKVA